MKKNVSKVNKNPSDTMYVNVFGKSIHFFHLGLIVFVFFAFGYILIGSVESAYLSQKGCLTKGIIIDIRRSGSKGVENYYYNFNYEGNVYSNSTLHLSKQIGDTVEVVFIKENPRKNRLRERLESTYGFFLRKNPNLKQE